MSDDFAGDTTTIGALSLGGSVSGVFEAVGDVDWFAITLIAGQAIALNGPAWLDGIQFFDAAGHPVALDFLREFDAINGTQSAGFTAVTSGTYYVGVSGPVGSYSLSAQLTGVHPEDVDTFPVITNGFSTPGFPQLDADGGAWFKANLTAGQTIELRSFQNNFVGSTSVVAYDVFGKSLVGQSGTDFFNFTAASSGTYYFELSDRPFATYQFNALIYTDDFADRFGDPLSPYGALSIGGTAAGQFEGQGDVDWFAITVTAGQTVSVTGLEGLHSILFYDAAGAPVAADFFRIFSAAGQSAGFTATTTGTYYVSVASGGPASYALTAALVPGDAPSYVSHFTPLVDGLSVQGVIGADQAHWFAVTLAQGETALIDSHTNNSVAFYSSFGEAVSSQGLAALGDSGFIDNLTEFVAPTAGTYYFSLGGTTGSFYDVSAQIYTDDFADGPTAYGSAFENLPTLNPTDTTVVGTTERPDDLDYFKVDLTAGQTLKVSLSFGAQTIGLVDVNIFYATSDPNGGQFHAQVSKEVGAEVVFTAPQSGAYYIQVRPPFDQYLGDYTLHVQTVDPSVAFDGQATIITAPPARPSVTTVSSQILDLNGATFTNPAGTILYEKDLFPLGSPPGTGFNVGTPVVYADNFPAHDTLLNNAGTIRNYSTAGIGGVGITSAVFADTVVNSGAIISELSPSYLFEGYAGNFGFSVALWSGGDVTNTGLIFSGALQASVAALRTSALNAHIDNSGTIEGQATWGQDPSQSGGAQGIGADNNIAIVNETTGKILAEADGAAWAVKIERGGFGVPGNTPQVENHGLIEAHARGAQAISYGVWIANLAVEYATIENFGTIRADFAVYAPSEGTLNLTSPTENIQTINNHAGALLDGGVALFRGDDVVHNQGTITGHVDMGDGNDLFDNVGGTTLNSIDLSFGNDTYNGGDGADAVTGGVGDDNIKGNNGADLLLGGNGDDVLEGGFGNDALYGENGNDQISTSGGDFVSGGGGDDVITAGDYTFAKLDGGAGYDTWILPTGARSIDLGLVAASGRVTGVEQINLSTSQTLVVHAADIAALSGGTQLVINDVAGDVVFLVGAWTATTSVSLNNISYAHYTSGTADVLVQIAATVSIGPTPPAATGLDAIAAGAAPPLPGSVPGADLTGPEVNVTGFVMTRDLNIGAGEIWQSLRGGAVLTANGFINFVNHGTVHSANPSGLSGNLGAALGLLTDAYATADNFGAILADTVGFGDAIAFGSGGLGTITNETGALIHATAAQGSSVAVSMFDGGIGLNQPGLRNSGTILGESINGFASGVLGHNNLFAINNGTIEAHGGDGAIGIDLSEGGGAIENHGHIVASAPLTSTFFSVGILSGSTTQIINDGTIDAEIAILIQTRFGEGVTIDNAGTITGDIDQIYTEVTQFGGVDLTNSNKIVGSILLSDGTSASHIVNSGTIAGQIAFGGGNDVYDGANGVVTGLVAGGAGDDTFTGGGAADFFYGDIGNDTLSGGGGDDTLNGGAGADTMSGGLGNDTYVVDNTGDLVTEAATGGVDLVQTSISYTLGANVENLTMVGTGGISGTGNALNNIIIGNDAANILQGAAGADTMIGGLGNDLYGVDNVGDVVSETSAAGGVDTVRSSISYVLGANVENLTLIGTGGISGTGNALNNIIIGNDAANILQGAAGADTMIGGLGNDLYGVDNVGDVVSETSAAGGVDTVRSSISYVLGANVENLTLIGAGAISGTGNALNNTIIGNDAANVINGGAGADTMSGGLGNDTYVVDNTGDLVTEAATGGVDLVQTSISYTLGANVENLTMVGTGGISGTGNALNNIIIGNDAANILQGAAGADTMIGGLGNDLYGVDNVGDVVSETSAAGGVDTVRSSISYVLGANVENLTLIGTGGISGTGNALNNIIIGNDAANILLQGAAGADTMIGGLGNDLYGVDNVGDVVSETSAAGGVDTVRSSISYVLGANVENLTLIGAGAISGAGNELSNVITGNAAANTIAGGAGADTLIGGAGQDHFVFASVNAADADIISDFFAPDDTISFDNAVFTALGPDGALAATAFWSSTTGLAHDADDRVIYNSTTGQLFYDADGNGAGTAILIATLSGNPMITSGDIFVI